MTSLRVPPQAGRSNLFKGIASSAFGLLAMTVSLSFFGCTQDSYPGDRLKDAIVDICRKEYGIENVDVKVAKTTIGVYLPLPKLFAADFKEAAITGKVRNLESLFEPAPEALDKVEDVLFTISRVILSTDRNLEFYVLQATDVTKTGMQLVLSGHVHDIKRVRIWDISREEYRKRIMHELNLNRTARWHHPVREFFKDLGELPLSKIQARYFDPQVPAEAIQNLFFNTLSNPERTDPKTRWEVLEMRSLPVEKNAVLVHAKVRPLHSPLEIQNLEYLFLLTLRETDISIERIVRFQPGAMEAMIGTLPLPAGVSILEDLSSWDEEFRVEPILTGPFLADQLTRRVQTLIGMDERIMNTFREVKLSFEYVEEPLPSHFILTIDSSLMDFNNYSRESMVFHEDMLYLLEVASREFVTVLRSYRFGAYDYLQLHLVQEPAPWIIQRDSLELFRQNKVNLQGLFSLSNL